MMKKHTSRYAGLLPIAASFVLLFFPSIAVRGASFGLDLCVKSVIPALFPMFAVSRLATNSLFQQPMAIFSPIRKLCSIPKGQESLFLIGILCGYPVGAQNISNAYISHQISRQRAKRMLTFCCNAGPSFIFGVTSLLFENRYIPWVLWGIQILSSVIIGTMLPQEHGIEIIEQNIPKVTLTDAVESAVKGIVSVCSWVILFRTIIEFLNESLFKLLPELIVVPIIGMLELTNGCIALGSISDECMRFVMCSGFLSIGGLCVMMQTKTYTKDLGMRSYISGKMLQCAISILCALLISPVLFSAGVQSPPEYWIALCAVSAFLILMIFKYRKKDVAFSNNIMYNGENAA